MLKLNEDIGVFDLAGQENQRWFETNDKQVFVNSKLIIIVVDVLTPIEEILNFVKKVLDIRNELASSSIIYLLAHKIDLISQKILKEIKSKISDAFKDIKSFKIIFTSIKKEFFPQTFSFFIEILKSCLEDQSVYQKLDFALLKTTIDTIYQIDREGVVSKKDLITNLNTSEVIIDKIINILKNKEHINVSDVQEAIVLSLTDKGKQYYKIILNNFSLDNYIKLEKGFQLLEIPTPTQIPPFVGCFIADKDGKTLMALEAYNGAIATFLKGSSQKDEESKNLDIELIPMFVSALEKFSEEIYITDLSGFNLKGSNLRFQIFGFDKFTVTFFINPNITVKALEKEIFDYFNKLFVKYRLDFDKCNRTGETSLLTKIEQESNEWLKTLNKKCEKMIINLEIFDFERAKEIYSKLDELQCKINLKFLIALEKIKKLKVDLTKAILNENLGDLKQTAKKTQDIQSQYEL